MSSIRDEYISSSEAAAILGLRPFGIQNLIRRGKLPAEKIANRWLIRKKDALKMAKTYKPMVGRPTKKNGERGM